jgi:hypothetical protein
MKKYVLSLITVLIGVAFIASCAQKQETATTSTTATAATTKASPSPSPHKKKATTKKKAAAETEASPSLLLLRRRHGGESWDYGATDWCGLQPSVGQLGRGALIAAAPGAGRWK